MTYRKVQGLWFKVFSPSLYELLAFDDNSGISLVTISFLLSRWHIHILMKAGNSHYRGPFRTRDEAVALIVGRLEQSA